MFEFLPYEPKWQLLAEPISLYDFERKPFVRSAFFQLGMRFPPETNCVLKADQDGRSKIEVLMEQPHKVVCHYQLRYADDSLKRFGYFAGHKLDRFVVFQVRRRGRSERGVGSRVRVKSKSMNWEKEEEQDHTLNSSIFSKTP